MTTKQPVLPYDPLDQVRCRPPLGCEHYDDLRALPPGQVIGFYGRMWEADAAATGFSPHQRRTVHVVGGGAKRFAVVKRGGPTR